MSGYDFNSLLRHDFSEGSDDFREDLLQRCLDTMAAEDGTDVSDETLELLAAAGDVFSQNALGGPYAQGAPHDQRH